MSVTPEVLLSDQKVAPTKIPWIAPARRWVEIINQTTQMKQNVSSKTTAELIHTEIIMEILLDHFECGSKQRTFQVLQWHDRLVTKSHIQ